MSDETPGGARATQARPHTRSVFVVALPRELGAGSSVAAAIPDVQPTFEGTKDDFSGMRQRPLNALARADLRFMPSVPRLAA